MASVPADLAVLDRDGDGNFDRIYAADTKGNLWRVDISDANPDNWASYKLAALGGTGANARKFLNKPDVVFGATYDAVLIGSGDREHPFETTVTNRFYMLKDTKVGLTGGLLCGASGAERTCVESDLTDVTSDPFQNTTATIPTGWYLTLSTGEKVVGNAVTAFGTTFFGTNLPTPPAPGVCTSNLGEARMYAVGYEAGTATLNLNGVSGLTATDRFEVLKGGGFPPSPVASRVVIDGKEVDVVCSGAHCLKPPTSSTSSRRARTYWYIKQ
jgi:type IV pilus assembly protein PilY1